MVTRGLGPTVAIEIDHRLGCSDFSLFGNMRGSALYGDRSVNANSDADVGPFRYDADSVILNAELQLGGEWRRGNFFSRVGVEAQYWGNVGNLMNTNSSGGDGGSANGSLFSGAIGLVGLSASVGVKY
jgi:hypothetical protein